MEKTSNDLLQELNKIKKLDDFHKENKADITYPNAMKYLMAIASANGISKSDIIVASNIERTYCHHILSGDKQPDRNKVIALAFAGKLNLEQTQYLLKYSCQRELYVRDERDCAIIFAINKGMNLVETEILLHDLGYDLIGKKLRDHVEQYLIKD